MKAGKGISVWLLTLTLLWPLCVAASEAEGFEFLVIGDTRSEAYLPPGMNRAGMEAILQQRYHGAGIRLELKKARPFEATILRDHGPLRLYYDGHPWPQRIDEYQQDAYRTIYTIEGFNWVMENTVAAFNAKEGTTPIFLIHGGDLILNGYQGRALSSPYWSLINEKLLNPLAGRVYAVVGNHETWEDEELEGMLTAMPWLKHQGFSSQNRIYSFDRGNSRFIFLNSGPQCKSEEGDASDWCSLYPGFEKQMRYLRNELLDAQQGGIQNVFVTYHKPSFIQVGHNPLPAKKNPHYLLKQYAHRFNIVVFNSHAHTTEHYLVDGIHYLVIGAGGAPQALSPSSNPSREKELYWQGAPRQQEYNLLRVKVKGARVEASLQRFRPGEGEGRVPLFVVQKQ